MLERPVSVTGLRRAVRVRVPVVDAVKQRRDEQTEGQEHQPQPRSVSPVPPRHVVLLPLHPSNCQPFGRGPLADSTYNHAMAASKPLSLARRAELFIVETVGEQFTDAGFRRKRLIFRRVHGDVLQLVQVYISVTVSGGASPPDGFFRVWIGCAGASRKATVESECDVHFELNDVVTDAPGTFKVPPTRGPKREAAARLLAPAIRQLVKSLDTVATAADLRRPGMLRLR